jgi:S1-C subfamily serine protease
MIVALAALIGAGPIGAQSKKKSPGKALSAQEVFKRALPSVVAIDCLGPNAAKLSTASGFIVSDAGRILTSFHVIQACQSMTVRLSNGDAYDTVNVVDTDVRKDLALIRIKAVSLPAIALGDSDEVEVGQQVYSIGNPVGLQNTLQQGLVSGTRQVEGFHLIQVSASINPGNSGGPILDAQARVVGIATAKVTGAENLGFAVPINYAKGLLETKTEMSFSTFALTMIMANKQAAAAAPPPPPPPPPGATSPGVVRPPAVPAAPPSTSAGAGAVQPPTVKVAYAVLARACTPGLRWGFLAPAKEAEFLTTDPQACFQVDLAGMHKGEKGRIEWRNPLGTVALTRDMDPGESASMAWQQSLLLAGQSASFTPGEWQVRVYWGEQGVVSLPFRVSEAAPNALELKSSTVLPLGTVNSPYWYRFTLAGGTPPYRWSGGDPASGLTLSSDGVLSGTPARQAGLRIPVKVEDSAGNSLARTVGLGVAPPPAMHSGAAVLTTSPNPADPCKSAAGTTAFRTTDSTVWVVFATQGGKANETGAVQWLNPAGDPVWFNTVKATKDGGECMQAGATLAKIKDLAPGSWRVRLLWDSSEVFNVPFTLVKPQ